MDEKGRCWTGHRPVPGKKPYSKGSCVKEGDDEIKEDLAFIFDKKVKAQKVVDLISNSISDLIESVTLFDAYQGPNLQEGKKSLAFSIRLRSPDRTLKTEEVQQVRNEIIAKVENEFEAQLR